MAITQNDRQRSLRLDDEPGRLRALDRTEILDTANEQQFDTITALVRDVLNVPICAVSLVDRDRQFFKSVRGLPLTETPRSVAICDHTIRHNSVMVVEDARLDPRFLANPLVTGAPHIRSYAGAPLVTADQYQIGALCVIDRRPRSYTDAQIALLQRFAGVVMDAIELRTLVHEDFLTGAKSRRAFTEELHAAVERQSRDGQTSVMIMIDLDHFKAVNDRFGHPAGDEVLKGVAASLRANLRAHQPLGRLGGEEFGVLLPGASLAEALICAERMRVAIQQTKHSTSHAVTASFGIAPLIPGETIEQWTADADRALYVAKHKGRNRCVLAPPHGYVAAA